MHDGTKVKALRRIRVFGTKGPCKAFGGGAAAGRGDGDPRSEESHESEVKAREWVVREKQQRLEVALDNCSSCKCRLVRRSRRPLRVSTTDPEARIKKQSDGRVALSYNAQISSDAQADLIVGIGSVKRPMTRPSCAGD